jgi:hypothetical protein
MHLLFYWMSLRFGLCLVPQIEFLELLLSGMCIRVKGSHVLFGTVYTLVNFHNIYDLGSWYAKVGGKAWLY